MLSWSSGLGRHPLTVEIAGSTPAGSGLNTRSIIFGFILDCCVWIKISDFKRSLIMQMEARITQDKILEDILAEEKIRDEMVDRLIHKIQKQR